MAKRFTDSEKFRNSWYRRLSPKLKCLWEYLLSECSIAGIIELDIESASFHIGDEITINDIAKFSEKLIQIDENKYFIPSFIKFQQNELNEKNPAHKNIIKELKKYNICVKNLTISESVENREFKSPFIGASKGQGSIISNSNSNSNSNSISNNYNYNYNKQFLKKFLNEYEKVFMRVPLIDELMKRKIHELLENNPLLVDKLPELFKKLKLTSFDLPNNRKYKPDLVWLLKDSNLIKFANGEIVEKETETLDYEAERQEELKKLAEMERRIIGE